MNVVFVCVDCLRGDFVTEDHADTPFIDSLRDTSLSFSNMHSTTTTTTPAVASFMTGCYSERNGVNSLRNIELSATVTTLAEKFSTAGYETQGHVTGPLVPETELDRGFDRYEHRESSVGVYDDWFDELIDDVQSLSDPFFLYVHTWELHGSITVPKAFDDPSYGDLQYTRALSALDRKLERLHEALPEETLFVLHGDHGESISTRNNYFAKGLKMVRDSLQWERGIDLRPITERINRLMKGHSKEIADHYLENGHGQTVYDFTTNVPLVLDWPDSDAETVSAQVRQIDIYPTLLDICDIPTDGDIDGESLLQDEIDDRIAYIRGCGESLCGERNWIRAVRLGDEKYIEFIDRDWKPERYALGEDPMELHPDHDIDPERYRRFFPTEELQSAADIGIDDHLEDLGYL
jgi:arylsulfatase A-like enzyme